jgi:hypothetical protein
VPFHIAMTKSEPQPQTGSKDRRFVTEHELMESLNRSLWEVERERVIEPKPAPRR